MPPGTSLESFSPCAPDLVDSLLGYCRQLESASFSEVVAGARELVRIWDSGVVKDPYKRKKAAYKAFRTRATPHGFKEFSASAYDVVVRDRAEERTAARRARRDAAAEDAPGALQGGGSSAVPDAAVGAEAEGEVVEEESDDGSAEGGGEGQPPDAPGATDGGAAPQHKRQRTTVGGVQHNKQPTDTDMGSGGESGGESGG